MIGDYCDVFMHLMHYRMSLGYTYTALSIFNCLVSIITTLSNVAVIIIFAKKSSLQSPSYLLLLALAISDLGVGLIVQPLYVAFIDQECRGNDENIYCQLSTACNFASSFFAAMSFFNMTAISVDRHLAVKLRLQYRMTVTRKRVTMVIFLLMLVSVLYALVDVLYTAACYIANAVIIPICLIITTFNYIYVGRMLRRQQNMIRSQSKERGASRRGSMTNQEGVSNPEPSGHDGRRLKKNLVTMLYIYGTFLICYTPFVCFSIAIKFLGHEVAVHAAGHLTSSIVLINSCLNPAIYFWRMPEMRQALKLTLC